METKDQKPMTIEDLATMVAGGFNDITSRMVEKSELNELKGEVKELQVDMKQMKNEMSELKHKMEALNSNVSNYVELAEKRNFESKERDSILTKGLKLVAEKTNTPIDVSQLEKI